MDWAEKAHTVLVLTTVFLLVILNSDLLLRNVIFTIRFFFLIFIPEIGLWALIMLRFARYFISNRNASRVCFPAPSSPFVPRIKPKIQIRFNSQTPETQEILQAAVGQYSYATEKLFEALKGFGWVHPSERKEEMSFHKLGFALQPLCHLTELYRAQGLLKVCLL